VVEANRTTLDPIFVVGTPRSGTTLTAWILGRHSRIFMPGETHFFEDVFARRGELGDIEDIHTRRKIIDRLATVYDRYYEPKDQQRVDALLASPKGREALLAPYRCYCEVLSRFMEMQMEHEKKARWGNHTPRDVFNVRDIIHCYPNAKILICVRDVRDFLTSYKTKWKITSKKHMNRLKALYHPVVTSLLWKSSVRQIPKIKQQVAAHNLMIMRYEDLVRSPETMVRKICESFEPNMLNIDMHNSSVQMGGRGIFSSSIGAWRSNLSAEETFIAQWLNGKELALHGYQKERQWVNPLSILWMFVSSPFAACRALYVNKGMRGSFIMYVYRRLSALFA
jgi:hypothetical protein